MRKLLVAVGLFFAGFAGSVEAQLCPGVSPWVFDDVLASDSFCPNITWLALNNITLGCAVLGPFDRLYCPDANITRKQMAAFMFRLGTGAVFAQGGNAFGATAMLGTTDNHSLELHVAIARVLRIEPPGNSFFASPNIIGGSPANNAAAGISGATIAGGGYDGLFCGPSGTSTCANFVVADFDTVGGGYGNTASGGESTVAGGLGNTASAGASTVAGGNGNTASVDFSTVAGGLSNTASGNHSTVAGGWGNTASGHGSFAAGTGAIAAGIGSFVWADSSGFPFDATNGPGGWGFNRPNTFSVRATGGVWFATAINGSGTPTIGVEVLSGSGSWSTYSDRSAKSNLADVDSLAVLDRVVHLPVSTWNYNAQDDSIRHMGPMAQDFHAAFGVGENDTMISVVDAQGVTLAAIQGLNAKLEERIAEQQREIADLRERVGVAESLLGEFAAVKAALVEIRRSREIAAAR